MEFRKFELVSKYKPTGDQPQAISSLVEGINDGLSAQVSDLTCEQGCG